jgi:hypothetical protein
LQMSKARDGIAGLENQFLEELKEGLK